MAVRILIVEDETIVATDIARGLKLHGYDRVEIVNSADDAVKAAAGHRPDLVLMDIRFHSGDNGIEAARRNGTLKGIPVIFLIDPVDEPSVERAKIAQPNRFLVKPFSDAELHTAVEVALHKNRGSEVKPPHAALEQRVVEQTQEITRLNQELEAFTYAVAHDLRAPLRGIAGYLGALREDHATEIPAPALAYLMRSIECTQRMQALMDDLLKLSRIGRQEFQRIATPLDRIANETIANLSTENQNRQIEWRVSELPTLACDPVLVRQLLMHLLSNAAKYTRQQPHAVIDLHHETVDTEDVIVISDNGVGFDMQRAGNLFTPFFRLHLQQEYEGTGVGLAICQRIVRRHGGRIWAKAEEGKGATFYFTLGGDA